MAFLVLRVTAVFTRRRGRIARQLLAAVVAGFSAVCALSVRSSVLSMIIVVAGFIASLFAAFWPFDRREFAKFLVIAPTVTCGVGGIGTAIYNLTGGGYYIYKAVSALLGKTPILALIITAGAAYGIFEILKRYYEHTAAGATIINAQITLSQRETLVTALVDTGHSLTEPISKTPVMVVELSALKVLLPESLIKLFTEGRHDNLMDLLEETDTDTFRARIRMIPYQAVSGRGMLVGFKPDSVNILREGQPEPSQMIIGIYTGTLSDTREFNALLGKNFLNTGRKRGKNV